ncbi:MAG: hypothetical protein JJE07_07810 [Flavobacteriaceae bacterium]|nr:hypothetical protein [Flavobacteriaceae bacterium]
MKFKLILTTIGCLFILGSCKNQDSADHNSETGSALEKSRSESLTESGNNKDHSKTGSTSKTDSKDSAGTIEGQYIRIGEEADFNCECYCLDLNFTSTSELCLSPDNIYINVKFEKANSNVINVFLVNPSDINSEGEKIPWDKFDRNIPIATITPQPNGELDLDWLGFSINGDLAMDYAIFGKKTLEGKFKKK